MEKVVGKKEKERRLSEEKAKREVAKTLTSANLSLYEAIPTDQVSIEEFEQSALDRLRVLKAIDDAQAKGATLSDIEDVISKHLDKYLRTFDQLTGRADPEGERKDAISHFVLRLAFCKTEELRRWFLQTESTLFKHRFKHLRPQAQVSFLQQAGLPYQPMGASEYSELRERLAEVLATQPEAAPGAREATLAAGPAAFYKVPFEEVAELVRGRRVLLVKGQAYVPREHLAVLVVGVFRTRLSKQLAVTARHYAAKVAPEEGDRLAPILEALATRQLGTGQDYTQGSGSAVNLATLDELVDASFPLCMRNVFLKLKQDHHLRHHARMQLGLFLKGIGLSLEDALHFFKTEFTKRLTSDQFEKGYAYNIRHNYGKEGKRADYTPYSCMKIIMSAPNAANGDHHGCPYRHFNTDNLRAALRSIRLPQASIDQALAKVNEKHYQLACGATFAGMHGGCESSGIQHPNQYFDESRAILAPAPAADAPNPSAAQADGPKTPAAATPPAPRTALAAMNASPP